jgi:hypothetical protein
MGEAAAFGPAGNTSGAGGNSSCSNHKYFYVAHVDFGMGIRDFGAIETGDVVETPGAVPIDPAARAAALRLDVDAGVRPEDWRAAAMKPLLISRVPLDVDTCECTVLFADGHAIYLNYPEDYPCTPEVMRALREIEAGLSRRELPGGPHATPQRRNVGDGDFGEGFGARGMEAQP